MNTPGSNAAGWAFGEYLRNQLVALGERRRGLAWVRGILWGFTLGGAVLAFAAWADLLVGMPGALRAAALLAAALGAPALLVMTLRSGHRAAAAERIARDVDRLAATGGEVSAALGLTECRVQNAECRVQNERTEEGKMADGGSCSALLSQGLAEMAVKRAEKIAGDTHEENIEPLSRAGSALLCAAALAVAALIVVAAWPDAARTEWARFSDPWGDHPPWSRYAFKVEPGNVKVLYGATQDIRAVVSGAPVEQLDLVVRQPDGTEEAMPMFEERDRSWRAQLAGIVAPMSYWVRGGKGGVSLRHRIEVINTPPIESVAVRVTPPAYTHRPAADGPMPQGGIAGFKGSEVRITVKSNRPLSRGEMEFSPASGKPELLTAAPSGEGKDSVAWTFPIRSAGKLSLSVLDEAGERSTARVNAAVLVVRDERPLVRILSPKARSFATPDIVLPVLLEAEDDCGISRLELFRSLNGTRHLPDALAAPAPNPPQITATVPLLLKDYGLAPGDVITLFGHVADNDPETPKGSESGVVTVTVISRELFDEIARSEKQAADLQAKYEEAARRAENLAAEAEKLKELAEEEHGEKPSPELQKKMAEFAKSLQEAAEKTDRAAERKDFTLDSDLAKPMHDLAQSLKNAAGEFNRAAKSGSPEEMRQAVAEGLDAIGAGRQAYAEKVERPLEKFMRAYEVLALEEKYVELCQRQADLAERTSNLKGQDGTDDAPTRLRMRELQDEQQQIKADTEGVIQEIWNRAHELPDDRELAKLKATAKAFSDAVRDSRAMPAMGEAAENLGKFQGTAGNARAAEASEALNSFLSKCGSGAGEAGAECELAFGPALQDAAKMTLGEMLGPNGGNVGYGGKGSGRDGYSMRTNARNIGLYGAAREAERSGTDLGGNNVSKPSASRELRGGDLSGGIKPEERAAAAGGVSALDGVPPQYRDSVRTYFKRVADETSAGAVIPEPGK